MSVVGRQEEAGMLTDFYIAFGTVCFTLLGLLLTTPNDVTSGTAGTN
jgi:hypothetical protein